MLLYCTNNQTQCIPEQCGWVGVFIEGHEKLSIFDFGVVENSSSFSCNNTCAWWWLNAQQYTSGKVHVEYINQHTTFPVFHQQQVHGFW